MLKASKILTEASVIKRITTSSLFNCARLLRSNRAAIRKLYTPSHCSYLALRAVSQRLTEFFQPCIRVVRENLRVHPTVLPYARCTHQLIGPFYVPNAGHIHLVLRGYWCIRLLYSTEFTSSFNCEIGYREQLQVYTSQKLITLSVRVFWGLRAHLNAPQNLRFK